MSEKVLLENPAGKRVSFAAGEVDYMLKHGWKKAQVKQSTKPKTEPSEAKK